MRTDKAKVHKEIARSLVVMLADYGAYIYHEATTGSVYVKFPHWALGSIRIGDHKGIGRYHYRWRVRTDQESAHVARYMDGVTMVFEVGKDRLGDLAAQFISEAKRRGVNPGDKETWEEHLRRVNDVQGMRQKG